MTKEEFRLLLARRYFEQATEMSRACDLIEEAMIGKSRRSGEPAVTHAYAVASLLLEIGASEIEVNAALLHDLPEDTSVTIQQIGKQFGAEVAYLVEAVSCDREFTRLGWPEQARFYYGKLFRCAQQDHRAVTIKLADRLHYFRTSDVMPRESLRQKAHETIELLLPMIEILTLPQETRQRIRLWLAELQEHSQRHYRSSESPFADFFASPYVRRLDTSKLKAG